MAVAPSPSHADLDLAHDEGANASASEARRRNVCLALILGVLAPLHALLPWSIAWVHRSGGVPAAEIVVVAMHLLGPLIYVPLYRPARLRWTQWALVLGLDHLFVLLGALPFWL